MAGASTRKIFEEIEVAVIGAGQAGLAASYYLKLAKIPHTVLDSNSTVGDSWRQRWDSLELFTPKPFASLPGLKLSQEYNYYPKKNEIAKYFKSYAAKFDLPVILKSNVLSVTKKNSEFIIETNQTTIRSQYLIIATGPYTKAFVPDFAKKLDDKVSQFHSSNYRNASQINGKSVAIIGGGNSAMQLTEELYAAGKSITLISSKMPWFLPKTILGVSSYWWFYLSGILNSSANSKVSKYVRNKGDGIIGLNVKKLMRDKEIDHKLSRVVDAKGGSLILENNESIPVSTIVWSTGFKPDYKWLNIDNTIEHNGAPIQNKGLSPVSGIFWLGLPWQSRMNSGIINGAGKDAEFIVEKIKSKRNN